MILKYSILNGALELLPQSVSTLAIIPLQMKMVYRIGKTFGYELDRKHITDLLATFGVGLTSQYVEEIGRKLLGGLLGKMGGGLLGGLGRQATGSAMAFATTYAIGQIAKRYYASGRTLDTNILKEAFQSLLGEGRALQSRYAGEIQERSRTIDTKELLSLVKR
ncbi:MAG: YcjF family protein [Burkholderiales bacterium]